MDELATRAAELAAPIIKEFEGFRALPYLCPRGVWTIGYGTTRINGVPVTRNTPVISKERAETLMKADMVEFTGQILPLVRVALTAPQLGALISLTYNIGIGNFQRSTLLRFLNAGRYGDAGHQFSVWVYSKGVKLEGLVRRRNRERLLFLSPDQ